MKAVVVELRDDFVAALSDDGCIMKVKNNNYVIGQVIEMKKITSIKTRMIMKISVAVASFLLLGGIGVYAYMAPTSIY